MNRLCRVSLIVLTALGTTFPSAGLAQAVDPPTRSAGYRVGIFPCEGEFGHAGTEWDRVINYLHATVQREPALMLAYSPYDAAYSEPPIRKPERLWTGTKPDLGLVYALGRERQVDAVVMCWMEPEAMVHAAWPGSSEELSLKL